MTKEEILNQTVDKAVNELEKIRDKTKALAEEDLDERFNRERDYWNLILSMEMGPYQVH